MGGSHNLQVEVPRKVVIDTQTSAIAIWEGGSPPYTIEWHFPRTIGKMPSRLASSPDTEKFVIPSSNIEVGKKYYVIATVRDAAGKESVLRKQFLLGTDPLKRQPSLFRTDTN